MCILAQKGGGGVPMIHCMRYDTSNTAFIRTVVCIHTNMHKVLVHMEGVYGHMVSH